MGISVQQQDPDLTAALSGGDTFLSRLQQLSDAKTAAEKAEASLALATSAKTILDQADARKADGDRALAQARQQADQIVSDAKAQADKLTTDAKAANDMALSDAAKVRADADSYAVEKRSYADSAAQETTRLRDQASSDSALVAVELSSHQSKSADMNAATAAAKRAEDRFNAALNVLQEAARQVTKA